MRFLAALLAIGCAEASTEAPPVKPPLAPKPIPPPVRLPEWRGNRTLPMLPAESAKLAEYQAATKAWRTATTAYALGDGIGSAEGFLESAAHLKGGPEKIAKAFATGRCLAYENAARAYSAAGKVGDARVKLTAAATADAACRHSIAAVLERFSEPGR